MSSCATASRFIADRFSMAVIVETTRRVAKKVRAGRLDRAFGQDGRLKRRGRFLHECGRLLQVA